MCSCEYGPMAGMGMDSDTQGGYTHGTASSHLKWAWGPWFKSPLAATNMDHQSPLPSSPHHANLLPSPAVGRPYGLSLQPQLWCKVDSHQVLQCVTPCPLWLVTIRCRFHPTSQTTVQQLSTWICCSWCLIPHPRNQHSQNWSPAHIYRGWLCYRSTTTIHLQNLGLCFWSGLCSSVGQRARHCISRLSLSRWWTSCNALLANQDFKHPQCILPCHPTLSHFPAVQCFNISVLLVHAGYLWHTAKCIPCSCQEHGKQTMEKSLIFCLCLHPNSITNPSHLGALPPPEGVAQATLRGCPSSLGCPAPPTNLIPWLVHLFHCRLALGSIWQAQHLGSVTCHTSARQNQVSRGHGGVKQPKRSQCQLGL